MSAGIKANVDGSAAIQVGGTDVITLTSGGAATFVTSPTTVQAGTAAAPSITFSGDTNTGIYSPGADTIAFTEGGVEAARFDSSGKFLVGTTTSPNQQAVIYRTSATTSNGALLLDGNGSYAGLQFAVSGTLRGSISSDTPDLYITHAGNINFRTGSGDNVGGTTRATITSGGDFLIGTTTKLTGGIDGLDINTSAETGITFGKSGTSKAYFYLLTDSSAFQWQTASGVAVNVVSNTNGVTLANGGTSWGTLSDERKKDIIEPITNAAEKVSKIRAVIGKYKTEEDGIRRSMLIAQDVREVLPEAVIENNDGNLILQYTDTIPLLVAAIKELKAELDATKAEVAALKGI